VHVLHESTTRLNYFNESSLLHFLPLVPLTSMSCHGRTRATRCITTNVLQTKVDVHRTKLITLATVNVFE